MENRKSFRKTAGLIFSAIQRKAQRKIENFTKHEPVPKSEAIERTLYLLRRDFDMETQNQIVFELIKKMNEKREADLVAKEQELNKMREQKELFEARVSLTE